MNQGPNPRSPIVDRAHSSSPAQALGLGFPMQTTAQFEAIASPTDHALIAQAATAVLAGRYTLLSVTHAQFEFVPFHMPLGAVRMAPTGTTEADLAAINHQHKQFSGCPLGFSFHRRLCQSSLGLCFGPRTHVLDQRVERRILYGQAPFGGHGCSVGVGGGGRHREGQTAASRWGQLLMGPYTPVLQQRATPVAVAGIPALPQLQFNRAVEAAQGLGAALAAVQALAALGGKPRRVCRRVVGVVLGGVGASILGLQPPLPVPVLRGWVWTASRQEPFSWGGA